MSLCRASAGACQARPAFAKLSPRGANSLAAQSLAWPITVGNSFSPRCPRFDRPGGYPIPAYSEFMPPPRLGAKAYGWRDTQLFCDDDPWGWHVTEYEEAIELAPGLSLLAQEILGALFILAGANRRTALRRKNCKTIPIGPTSCAPLRTPRRTLRDAHAAGAGAHARRQGARPLDILWRQRTRTVARVLAQLLFRSKDRAAGRRGVRLHPPAVALRPTACRSMN